MMRLSTIYGDRSKNKQMDSFCVHENKKNDKRVQNILIV